MDTLVAKVGEEGVASDAVDLIAQGKVQLVVNTPRGLGPRADGQHIRMASVTYKVPCLTTLAAARAAAAGMADARSHPLRGARRCRTSIRSPGRGRDERVRPAGRAAALATRVGGVELDNPVMTASGTSGHGTELADVRRAGRPRRGRREVALASSRGPATRRRGCTRSRPACSTASGCRARGWRRGWPTTSRRCAARARASSSASGVAPSSDYAARRSGVAAAAATEAGRCIAALEVNVSCPNVEDRSRMFAHSAEATARVMAATACGLPRWAKLSPNVPDVVEIAAGALDGGADALTLVNTLLGLALDTESGRPVLGAGGGGLSGERRPPGGGAGRLGVPGCLPRRADRRRRRGDVGRATPSSCSSPGPTPCRSARPPSATRGHRGRCCASWRAGAGARSRSARCGRTPGGARDGDATADAAPTPRHGRRRRPRATPADAVGAGAPVPLTNEGGRDG